jgi:hypothetical protein
LGAGVLLAASQNLAQLMTVELLFIRHSGFYFQIPAMLFWSLLSGAFTAVLACKAAPLLSAQWENPGNPAVLPSGEEYSDSPRKRRLAFLAGICGLILVLATPYVQLQLGFFLASCAFLLWGRVPQGASRWAPFRLLFLAWPLLLFQAWLHLWQGEGELLRWGVTRQGLDAFLLHALQLLNVILIGPRLARSVPRASLARSASPYFRGFALALNALPRVLGGWSGHAKALRRALREMDITPLLNRLG